MSRPRHPRTDGNQASMVAILRSIGYVVWLTDSIGGAVLDLIVFKDGQTRVVEVKRPGHAKMLTPNEQASIDALADVGVEAIVAETFQDVVDAFKPREWHRYKSGTHTTEWEER